MISLLRRCCSCLIAVCAVVILGPAYAFGAPPTPVPGPPGAGVTAWTCVLRDSPSPSSSPAPLVATAGPTSSPSPTTVLVPDGQDCAATAYAPAVPPVSSSPVSGSVSWPSCSTPSGSISSPTSSPTPVASAWPSPSRTVLGIDCPILASPDGSWTLVLYLFLGTIMVLLLVAFVRSEAVGLFR